jgi:pimeloyl-ACP methyl ester carboxylesterase
VTELCVIHPGELSPLSWTRIVGHLPAGTRLRVLELEALNGYWEHDPAATVTGLADRLRVTLDPRIDRVLVGWGVGGVIAEALAARMAVRPRRTILLDSVAPYVSHKPSDADLRRSYAMLVCARRGRAHLIPTDALDPMIERLSQLGFGAVDILRKGYFQHHRTQQFNYRLTARHEPAGVPVTVVQPTGSLYGDLGWDMRVELLAAGGDHYTMLTDPDNVVSLALLLTRWLSPAYAAA